MKGQVREESCQETGNVEMEAMKRETVEPEEGAGVNDAQGKAPGIYRALANVCKNIGVVEKNQLCDGAARYRYRGIDDVYNALHGELGANGVFILPQVLERRERQRETTKGRIMEYVLLRVRYEFCHMDGSRVSCEVIGEAMDSGDKGTNKAMAIAHKYALLQMFCIPTQDMPDPDAESVELAPARPETWMDDFRGFLNEHYKGNQKAIKNSLSDFFQRNVRSMEDISRGEAEEFMEACLHG